jgi:flagellar biosynthetic protein FlhB
MAEADGQEKSEQASGKKLGDARNKGQVAKSIEINSFAMFLAGVFLIAVTQNELGSHLSHFSTDMFARLDKLQISRDLISDYFWQWFLTFLTVMAPIFIGLVIVAFVANVAQVGFKFSTEALQPKFSKMNPFSNIKNLFFSSRSAVELGKSLFKLTIVGLFTYWVIQDLVVKALGLVDFTVQEIAGFMITAATSLIWKVSLIYALLAGSDFAFQKFKFKKDMMMTKQEVKEENKQSEGDPQVKGKIKSMQFAAARKRMMKDVPKADVVITNPTHVAIAIQYKPGQDTAPKVLAKGLDDVAQKIKQIARDNGIPLHEDVPLARALYKVCDIGDEIPENLFKAVAQILAYVFRIKNEKKKKSIV